MYSHEEGFRERVAEAVLNGAVVQRGTLCFDKWVVVMPDGRDACEKTVEACFERLFEEQDGGRPLDRLGFAMSPDGMPVFVLNGRMIGQQEIPTEGK